MDSFQRFLENLPKMPLEERMQMFRHEALRPLNMAQGIAKYLQKETADCSELSDEAHEWFKVLLKSLEEMQQLLYALSDDPNKSDSM